MYRHSVENPPLDLQPVCCGHPPANPNPALSWIQNSQLIAPPPLSTLCCSLFTPAIHYRRDEQTSKRPSKPHSPPASAAPAASSKSPYRKCRGINPVRLYPHPRRRGTCRDGTKHRPPRGGGCMSQELPLKGLLGEVVVEIPLIAFSRMSRVTSIGSSMPRSMAQRMKRATQALR